MPLIGTKGEVEASLFNLTADSAQLLCGKKSHPQFHLLLLYFAPKFAGFSLQQLQNENV